MGMPFRVATAVMERGTIESLVERAQSGDRDALEELYLEHFDRIYSYLHMTVGNRHDAEDLTTQTFLRMLESIGKFRWGAAPFSAWLFRIAHNLAMDHFRSRRRWQPEEEVPEPDGSAESSAEEEAFKLLSSQSMFDLIESLSDEQRQVLILKFVFDFSNQSRRRPCSTRPRARSSRSSTARSPRCRSRWPSS